VLLGCVTNPVGAIALCRPCIGYSSGMGGRTRRSPLRNNVWWGDSSAVLGMTRWAGRGLFAPTKNVCLYRAFGERPYGIMCDYIGRQGVAPTKLYTIQHYRYYKLQPSITGERGVHPYGVICNPSSRMVRIYI